MRRANTLRNYYKLLEIPFDASDDEVKSAYRRLAKQYHPDLMKNAEAAERMKLINEAYEVLNDKRKRAVYDYIFFGFKAWVQKEQYRYPELGTVQPVYRPGFFQQIVSSVVVTIIELMTLDNQQLYRIFFAVLIGIPMILCILPSLDYRDVYACIIVLGIIFCLLVEFVIRFGIRRA